MNNFDNQISLPYAEIVAVDVVNDHKRYVYPWKVASGL